MTPRTRLGSDAVRRSAELAPEFKYPSQLIEIQAGYHYLVNTLGIEEDKICISGDSAGGNLAVAFLMHLARPNPKISVPEDTFGPVPKQPGVRFLNLAQKNSRANQFQPQSAFLISPFVNLLSDNESRRTSESFDYIENGGAYRIALDYIGAPPERDLIPSFNPYYWFKMPHPPPPKEVFARKKRFTGEEGRGIDLLFSPYVNPSVNEDLSWWKEALPNNGRTMICWGEPRPTNFQSGRVLMWDLQVARKSLETTFSSFAKQLNR